ncbi:hypothetical protein JXQ70_19815 [bacterium]|nr:hypothetical protein [bacterium]
MFGIAKTEEKQPKQKSYDEQLGEVKTEISDLYMQVVEINKSLVKLSESSDLKPVEAKITKRAAIFHRLSHLHKEFQRLTHEGQELKSQEITDQLFELNSRVNTLLEQYRQEFRKVVREYFHLFHVLNLEVNDPVFVETYRAERNAAREKFECLPVVELQKEMNRIRAKRDRLTNWSKVFADCLRPALSAGLDLERDVLPFFEKDQDKAIIQNVARNS